MKPLPERPGFLLDIQICTGCKTCMVACKDKNDLPTGVNRRRVIEQTGGQWVSEADGTFSQDIFTYYISISCNHCSRPLCVEACPTTAMQQDEKGIVWVDQEKCIGCRACEDDCPYGAPQFQADLGRMSKCDFCRDELATGGVPACVAACPTRALLIGEREELMRFQGEAPAPAPLPDNGLTSPAAVFKPTRRH